MRKSSDRRCIKIAHRKKTITVAILTVIFVILSMISANSVTEPYFEIGNASGKAGDTVEVTLSINNNPGITAFSIRVSYSANDLKLTELMDCKLFDESLTHSPIKSNPVTLSWFSGKTQNIKKNGAVVKLKFQILNGAKSSSLKLSYDSDNIFDNNFNNQKFKTIDGKITVSGSSSTKYKLGDVNRDGKITRADSELIQKSLAELITLDREQLALSDVTKKNSVNIEDASMIQKYCAGIIKKF